MSLAGDGRGGVAVGLPVDLLGAAEQLLGLGPHLVEDAHGPPPCPRSASAARSAPRCDAPGPVSLLSSVGFRGPVRSSLVPRCDAPGPVSLRRTAAARPPPLRVP